MRSFQNAFQLHDVCLASIFFSIEIAFKIESPKLICPYSFKSDFKFLGVFLSFLVHTGTWSRVVVYSTKTGSVFNISAGSTQTHIFYIDRNSPGRVPTYKAEEDPQKL